MSPRKVGFAPIVISVLPVMVASSSGARTCPCPVSTDGATVMPAGETTNRTGVLAPAVALGMAAALIVAAASALRSTVTVHSVLAGMIEATLGYSPASSRVRAVVCPADQVTQRVPSVLSTLMLRVCPLIRLRTLRSEEGRVGKERRS